MFDRKVPNLRLRPPVKPPTVPLVFRRGRGIAGVVALALVALIALAGTALADNFQGSTSEGGYVRVKTNERNVPELLVVRWRAECGVDGTFYRSKNSFAGPFRSQSRNHFRDFKRYRNADLEDGFTSVVTTQYRGRRVAANRWSGSFQAWVIVKQDGDFFTRCRTGALRWTAVRG